MIVYISIGNSDDKLSQVEWNNFINIVDAIVDEWGTQKHGVWFSDPRSPYQNACWCVELPDRSSRVALMKGFLAEAAQQYRQDSVAWTEATDTQSLSLQEWQKTNGKWQP